MPQVIFFPFREVLGKIQAKSNHLVKNNSVSQHSVSHNTNMVADESQHQLCPIELQQQQQEMLWRKQESVSLLSGSSACWCSAPQGYLFRSWKALALCLLHWIKMCLSFSLAVPCCSASPPKGHTTFKEMTWRFPCKCLWNFFLSAPPGDYVSCSMVLSLRVYLPPSRNAFLLPSSQADIAGKKYLWN